jgi:hypothetical protein
MAAIFRAQAIPYRFFAKIKLQLNPIKRYRGTPVLIRRELRIKCEYFNAELSSQHKK